mgnify:CR=1 FL=1
MEEIKNKKYSSIGGGIIANKKELKWNKNS